MSYALPIILALASLAAACPPACPPAQNTVRNEVHRVKLPTCGPAPAPLPVINEAHVAPAIEQPIIPLPVPPTPPAQTVAHHATCQKTVLKPQVYQQLVIVPYYTKYLRTCYKPVLETINYKSPLPLPPPEPVAPAAPLPPALPPCLPPSLPPFLPPAFPPCLPSPFPFCS